MITTIIFDLGNVLVDYHWDSYLRSFGFDEDVYRAIANAMFLSPQWDDFDKGICSEEEILQLFIRNAPLYEQELRLVFSTVGKTVSAFPYALEWIAELKEKGYLVYYLSNYSETTHKQTLPELPFLSLMDGGIMSYEVKQTKPDPAIYHLLLDKYQIDPQSAVFLDDLPANIETAGALGLHTICFRDREEALRKLTALGVH